MDIKEALLIKFLREVLTITSLSRSQQQMQATDIQEEEIRIMSMNLPLTENTTENLRPIIRSHKTRSTFYTENTCGNHFVNQIVAAEDTNNIVCQIDCNNCRVVYFGECKRP